MNEDKVQKYLNQLIAKAIEMNKLVLEARSQGLKVKYVSTGMDAEYSWPMITKVEVTSKGESYD